MLSKASLILIEGVLVISLTACTTLRSYQGEKESNLKAEVVFENAPIVKPRERFDKLLRQIEGPLKAASEFDGVDERISSLNLSNILLPLRRFQVLVYLYQKQYPELKPYYEHAKSLENHLGHQSDLKAFLIEARASGNQTAIEKAEKNLKLRTDDLKSYMASSRWLVKQNDLVSEIQSKLSSISWLNLEDDRNMVLSRLAKKLKKQHEAVYEMELPEEGMHELRRDVRRFTYLNEAASSFIVSDVSNKCSALTVDQYNQLTDFQKSAIIPEVVPNPTPKPTSDYFCHVESCLQQKLDFISSSLVPLKFQGSLQLARGEPVSLEIIKKAKELYEELIKSNVYLFLWNQLGNCRTKDFAGDDAPGDDN